MSAMHWWLTLTLLVISNVSVAEQSDYNKWKAEHLKSYNTFSEQYLKRYQEYKDKLQQQWGSASELSDNDTYVVYSDDLSHKTVVDFSLQEIRVEVFADENNRSTAELQQQALTLVSQPIAQLVAADPLLQGVKHHETQSLAQALLPDLPAGELVPTDNVSVEEFSVDIKPLEKQLIKPAQPVAKLTDAVTKPVLPVTPVADATSKRVKRVTIRLNGQDLYQRRALQYQEQVHQQAKLYDVDSAVLLAIMQVESSFNPLAQSPVPAFGLMQIVPESAGKDVNNRVFKRKQSPNAEQLFKPDENIMFGSAYVNILDKTYLAGIKDATSRLYCTIAAYNTGAGNVASVFHPRGQKRLVEAIKVINSLSSEEVYSRLINELPYEETRKYLQKVTSAIPQYHSI